MISTKHGLDLFYAAFKEAVGEDDVMDNQKFFYAIILLAKVMKSNESNPFEVMYAEMLIDRMTGGESKNVGGRAPILDDETFDILSEQAIVTYIGYFE